MTGVHVPCDPDLGVHTCAVCGDTFRENSRSRHAAKALLDAFRSRLLKANLTRTAWNLEYDRIKGCIPLINAIDEIRRELQ